MKFVTISKPKDKYYNLTSKLGQKRSLVLINIRELDTVPSTGKSTLVYNLLSNMVHFGKQKPTRLA